MSTCLPTDVFFGKCNSELYEDLDGTLYLTVYLDLCGVADPLAFSFSHGDSPTARRFGSVSPLRW